MFIRVPAEHWTNTNSFHAPNNPLRKVLFYWWGNWGTQSLINWPKVIELVSGHRVTPWNPRTLPSSCLQKSRKNIYLKIEELGSKVYCKMFIKSSALYCCLVAWSCPTAAPWIAACQAFLSFTISWSLFKLMSIESVMPSNHLVLCPLLLLPSVFPSIRTFSSELALRMRWPKYWSFSFSISPSSEYSALISFRMDWFDLLAVQEALKSLLQHYSSKESILWHSAFLIVQLSHPYMSTGKTIALTIWIFVGKVMSLVFHMLSRFVIAFLPRSKHLLILWLQSPSEVISEPKKMKTVTVSIVSLSYLHEEIFFSPLSHQGKPQKFSEPLQLRFLWRLHH